MKTQLQHIASRVIVQWTRRSPAGHSSKLPYLPYDPDLASWIVELGAQRQQTPAASGAAASDPAEARPYLPFDPDFERWAASLEPLTTA